ncbi:MAG TPA: hypothetical protein VL422_11630 [Miltoncostaea sp.]|nr:hypothetical protein [Miltoncostaea sp.]
MAVVTDDGEDAIEWWTVLVLRTEGDQRIHFIERRTAEIYARFLLEDDTPLVVLEHWRETGRVDVELIEALPER